MHGWFTLLYSKKKKKKHNIVKQLYSNQKEKEVAPIID